LLPNLYKVRYSYDRAGRKISQPDTEELFPIRIQPSEYSRQNGQGAQVFAEWKIFLPPETDILATDFLRYNGKDFSILSIYPVRDIDNTLHHYEVRV